MALGAEEIERRFGYHKPVVDGDINTAPIHAELRRRFMRFAETLDAVLPDGREKSVAFTELENSAMWAHKAIARQDPIHYEDNS